jgi:predicted MPP superfamily phosphohydrolase
MKKPLKKALVIGTLVTALILCLSYAYFVEPFELRVNEYRVEVKGLYPVNDGLRIVAICDKHGGSRGVDAAKIREVVRLANAENPDIVVLLGDYVSENLGRTAIKMPIGTIAENLKGLRSRFGVYAVLGNHDGWFDDNEVASELRGIGYTVLQNEAVTVFKDGRKFTLLGLKDHMKAQNWANFSNENRAVLEKIGDTGDVIAIEHSPDILPMITGDLSISPMLRLIIAGHTHGGQIRFPILGAPIVPSSYGQKYASGQIRENGVDMFVTTGVGTSIFPLRFMVPPEIAVLTLASR